MTQKEQNTPSLRTAEEMEIERRNEYKKYLLDPREDYPEPYYMFEFNGVPFSPLGGIQAISGQKKNGKSHVLTMLMAVALSGSLLEKLPGLEMCQRTIKYKGHKPSILYADTEMEKLNSAKVMRRVFWMNELPMNHIHDRFNVLWLKTMPKDDNIPAYQKRFELLKYAIEDLSPDLVFIDGLRDLLPTVNDEAASTQILEYLMDTAEKRQICIWCSLHQNPKANSDTGDKMRGWIGTELGNKVTDTLICSKHKTSAGVTFTVKQEDARNKDMEDWLFEVTDDAGNLGIPTIIGHNFNIKRETEPDSKEDIIEWLNRSCDIGSSCKWPMSKNKIKKDVFGIIGGIKNSEKQQADLVYALNQGILVETDKVERGHPLINISDDLTF